jgi:ATP dependent DNA ligase C terminal region
MATLPAEAVGCDLRSLLVGYHRDDKLDLAGKVGTGFTRESGHQLAAQLPKLKRAKPPFAAVPREYRRGSNGSMIDYLHSVAEEEIASCGAPSKRRRSGIISPGKGEQLRADVGRAGGWDETAKRLLSIELGRPRFAILLWYHFENRDVCDYDMLSAGWGAQ